MTQDLIEVSTSVIGQAEGSGSLPFPFNQQSFCRYEPVEQRIDEARVLVVQKASDLKVRMDVEAKDRDHAKADWPHRCAHAPARADPHQ